MLVYSNADQESYSVTTKLVNEVKVSCSATGAENVSILKHCLTGIDVPLFETITKELEKTIEYYKYAKSELDSAQRLLGKHNHLEQNDRKLRGQQNHRELQNECIPCLGRYPGFSSYFCRNHMLCTWGGNDRMLYELEPVDIQKNSLLSTMMKSGIENLLNEYINLADTACKPVKYTCQVNICEDNDNQKVEVTDLVFVDATTGQKIDWPTNN